MKRHDFTAAESIGWLSIVRPGMFSGSLVAQQQIYLHCAEAQYRASAMPSPDLLRPASRESHHSGPSASLFKARDLRAWSHEPQNMLCPLSCNSNPFSSHSPAMSSSTELDDCSQNLALNSAAMSPALFAVTPAIFLRSSSPPMKRRDKAKKNPRLRARPFQSGDAHWEMPSIEESPR